MMAFLVLLVVLSFLLNVCIGVLYFHKVKEFENVRKDFENARKEFGEPEWGPSVLRHLMEQEGNTEAIIKQDPNYRGADHDDSFDVEMKKELEKISNKLVQNLDLNLVSIKREYAVMFRDYVQSQYRETHDIAKRTDIKVILDSLNASL